MENDPSEILVAQVERLFQKGARILDRQQRTYALGKKLRRLSPEMIVEIFRITCQGARLKRPLYQDGLRILSDLRRLTPLLGLDKMSEVYTLARRKDYQDVVRMMGRFPAQRRVGEGAEDEPTEDPVLKEITLGQRKSMARTRDRDLLNRLCHDQNPAVIYNLLQNPHLTVKEVIRIASKRPTNAQVLWVVYRNLRWISYYPVKKALVNNPYSPPQMALSLTHFLLEQDLEDVAEGDLLHPRLQESALDILSERRRQEAKKTAEGEV
ncbi:MAG: hypothetical protein A2V67_08935 [Deltaproteobacteria bacterium RBG_13_61_14]|nr:MAG: hypothetical protein A2V67_08935 [Deltaproteobacteria bacterium RBG_13_61_14]